MAQYQFTEGLRITLAASPNPFEFSVQVAHAPSVDYMTTGNGESFEKTAALTRTVALGPHDLPRLFAHPSVNPFD
jgi:hypothetical protein